jgi:hypothetical protein
MMVGFWRSWRAGPTFTKEVDSRLQPCYYNTSYNKQKHIMINAITLKDYKGRTVGHFLYPELARLSLALSWGAHQPKITQTGLTMTVKRKGFDDLEYTIEPLVIYSEIVHL